jgi:hypothetical protein
MSVTFAREASRLATFALQRGAVSGDDIERCIFRAAEVSVLSADKPCVSAQ